MTYRGKALIHVTRTDSRWVPFDIRVTHLRLPEQPANTERDTYAPVDEVIEEEILYMRTRTRTPLSCMNRMQPEDRLTIAIQYEINFTTDYWGEADSELWIKRAKVLRRRGPEKQKYASK